MLTSSTIIENIGAMQKKAGLASLAIFYFDSKEGQKKDLQGLLSSLLIQLGHQSTSYYDILSGFYANHSNQHPKDTPLFECLKYLLEVSKRSPIYLILVALDKCSNTSAFPSPRWEILMLLKDLISSKIQNLYICVTSQLETDIQDAFSPLNLLSISLHDENGHRDDIYKYIKSAVTDLSMMQKWEEKDKEWAIKVLKERADGR